MCRGKSFCSELGDVEMWSDLAPLPPPEWIRSELPMLAAAFAHAASGDIAQAIAAVESLSNERMRDWCVEHGQGAGGMRLRTLGSPPPPCGMPSTGPRNPDSALATTVLERDRYQCRYCGLPVIPRPLFVALGAVVGNERFPTGKRNAERHGARLAFGAQVDHVVPYSLGGRTELDNLVTSCWTCNFGKASYHIAQIGVSDPRLRPPSGRQWDGLTSMYRALRGARRAT